jgi:sortase A
MTQVISALPCRQRLRARATPRWRRIGMLAALGLALSQFASAGYLQAKAMLAQELLERAWRQTLRTGEAAKPWPWADLHPSGILRAPRLGARNVLLDDISPRSLAFGPGLARGLRGAAGTQLVSAHRDTHFSWLKGIAVGDELILETRDGTQVFKVAGTRVVHADHTRIDLDTGDGLILSTCWPVDGLDPGTSWRFLVFAQRA